MGEHDEFLADFLEECDENLDQLDQELVALEEDPHNQDRLRSIFRNVHTIKGSSGFFGFAKLGALAHEGETLLGKVRDGELIFNQAIASGLLEMADSIREILAHIEQTGGEGDRDYGQLADKLRALLVATDDGDLERQPDSDHTATERLESQPTEPQPPQVAEQGPRTVEQRDVDRNEAASPSTDGNDELVRNVEMEPASTEPSLSSESIPTQGKMPERMPESMPEEMPEEMLGEVAASTPSPAIEAKAESAEIAPSSAANSAAAETGQAKSAEAGSIRVDIGLLDELMDFAGELVLARNSLTQCSELVQDSKLAVVANRVSQITSEIQDRVTRTRMQPIGAIWGRFRRIVRDLAVACGKEVRLELEGEDTELDRSLLEAIRDPLTHIIRNGVDHGIEPPDVRQACGKPREGVLRLWARHESGQVVIEAIDDGAGIDVEKVRAKATAARLMTPEEAAEATTGQVLQCIFEPGLSTAQKVSAISGRGVGMDVVRSHIERIGGSVQLRSVLGEGTTLTIKIPLTLAIVPALTVAAGGQQFVIPQASLMELVTVSPGSPIEWLHEVPVYRLRGHLLPLVWLDQLLGLAGASQATSRSSSATVLGEERQKLHVAVLKVDQLRYGLVIDEVLNSQEIVVKPIGASIKSIGAYSAATILGDGSVALILDTGGIARLAGLVREDSGRPTATRGAGQVDAMGRIEADDSDQPADREGRSLLVCEIARDRQVGIPMEWVERLEELPLSQLEQLETGLVASYRGGILPIQVLVRGQQPSPTADRKTEQAIEPTAQIVVCRKEQTRVGVLVQRVLDIVPRAEVVVGIEQAGPSEQTGQDNAGLRADQVTLVQGRVLEVVNFENMMTGAR